MRERLALATALALGLSVADAADAPRFGQPITPADLAPWDISIAPDGIGLPPGSGTSTQGAKVYADHGCALCHGEKGSGGPSGPLVGGGPLNSTDREPVKLNRQLLALCHDHLRLHPSSDAVATAEDAHGR